MNVTLEDLTKASIDMKLLDQLTRISTFLYFNMVYLVGVPQVLLNLSVITLILLYGNWLKRDTFSKGQNVLIFILNLALADVASFGAMLTAVPHKWRVFNGDYSEMNPDHFWSRTSSGCKVQVAVWCFSYANSLLSTVFLTLERYFLISKPLTYEKYMNKKVIVTALVVTWIVPAIHSALQAYSNVEKSILCVPSHTKLQRQIAGGTVGVVMLVTLIVLHTLYSRILLSFWRLKRRLSMQRSKSQSSTTLTSTEDVFGSKYFESLFATQNDPDLPKLISVISSKSLITMKKHAPVRRFPRRRSSVVEFLARVQTLIKTAKYVIVILIALTLCWLPWLLLFFGDIIYHTSGLYNRDVQGMCGFNSNEELPISQKVQLQLCINGLINNATSSADLINCNFNSPLEIKCQDIYEQGHEYLISKLVETVLFIASLNSLINPIVYTLCSSEFRNILGKAATDIKRILKLK